MKIYVLHSRNYDFQNELYKPLKQSKLPIEFIFPHEKNDESFNSKELLESHGCDYILAEVSFPSTGQGIELGWADVFGIPVIAVYKKGTKPAGSIEIIAGSILEYTDEKDLVNKLSVHFGFNIA